MVEQFNEFWVSNIWTKATSTICEDFELCLVGFNNNIRLVAFKYIDPANMIYFNTEDDAIKFHDAYLATFPNQPQYVTFSPIQIFTSSRISEYMAMFKKYNLNDYIEIDTQYGKCVVNKNCKYLQQNQTGGFDSNTFNPASMNEDWWLEFIKSHNMTKSAFDKFTSIYPSEVSFLLKMITRNIIYTEILDKWPDDLEQILEKDATYIILCFVLGHLLTKHLTNNTRNFKSGKLLYSLQSLKPEDCPAKFRLHIHEQDLQNGVEYDTDHLLRIFPNIVNFSMQTSADFDIQDMPYHVSFTDMSTTSTDITIYPGKENIINTIFNAADSMVDKLVNWRI